MNRLGLIVGLVVAATALGGIIIDGIYHQAFGWER